NAVSYAVVVLNQRLPRFAPLLWTRARLRVCADGGANRVFDGMPDLLPGEDPDEVRVSRYKPDAIEGDMDSVRPEVKEYYSSLGTQIIDDSPDQDTTDLNKCISFITRNPPGPDNSNVHQISLQYLLKISLCNTRLYRCYSVLFNCSSSFSFSVRLEEGSITRWGTSTCCIASQTPGSSSCQTTPRSFCSQRRTVTRSTSSGLSRVLIVD
uniref:Thiamin pyrophosphokinase catalytic domain-containing protein n=2 Tax=Aegilops tauschii subsp. strangulata TaxID=200361 RepID=A0A453GG00_AEGTS